MKKILSLILALVVIVFSFGNSFQFFAQEIDELTTIITDSFTATSENTYYTNSNIYTPGTIYTSGNVHTPGNVFGYLIYTVSNNEATVVGCRTSIRGDFTIPSTLGGYPVTSIGDSAFRYCSKLTSITIPDSVTSIGNCAFENCSSLTSITIPDSVTSIGESAFYNCSSLTSITIPDSVTNIGVSAFYGCSSLTKVNITNLAAWCNIDFYCSTISYPSCYSNPLCYAKNLYINGTLATDILIPDSVTEIKDYIFYSCNSLKTVTIPDSVTSIGNFAFSYCDSLTSITIPNSVTRINQYTFFSCDSLNSITIPDSVTYIGSSVFDGCNSLTKVNITNLTAWCNIDFFSYDSNPLYYAKNLYINGTLANNITIPNDVTAICDMAFYNCSSLTEVTIPDSVASIGKSAFNGCSSLKNVTIGKGVNYIGSNAFSGCTAIDTVFFVGSATKLSMILQPNNTCLTNAKTIYYHNYHQYGDWVTSIEPTCVNMGGKYHTCVICDGIEHELILPTGEHTYENGVCVYCGDVSKTEIPNDINGDGKLDSTDMAQIKKVVLNAPKSTENYEIYDINSDNNIDILDLICMKKLLAKV